MKDGLSIFNAEVVIAGFQEGQTDVRIGIDAPHSMDVVCPICGAGLDFDNYGTWEHVRDERVIVHALKCKHAVVEERMPGADDSPVKATCKIHLSFTIKDGE